jgi:hypothetical protein
MSIRIWSAPRARLEARDAILFLKVALPGSVPILIAGLRIAVGRALTGVVAAELFGATGRSWIQHRYYGQKLKTNEMMVSLVLVVDPRRDLYPASLASGIGNRFLADGPGPLKEPSWTRGCASFTGGGQGIGRALSHHFAENGISRRRGRAGRAKRSGGSRRDRGEGRRSAGGHHRRGKSGSVRDLFARVKESYGRVDILINNARWSGSCAGAGAGYQRRGLAAAPWTST